MDEEKIIMERCGKKNPFSTPEGYFEALPLQVMDRIRQRRRNRTIWKWAAAAAVAGVISTAGMMSLRNQSDALMADDMIYTEDALDYSMINNLDIVYYISEAK